MNNRTEILDFGFWIEQQPRRHMGGGAATKEKELKIEK
jgi:hypothetical protein